MPLIEDTRPPAFFEAVPNMSTRPAAILPAAPPATPAKPGSSVPTSAMLSAANPATLMRSHRAPKSHPPPPPAFSSDSGSFASSGWAVTDWPLLDVSYNAVIPAGIFKV